METLLDPVRRYTQAHADGHGVARTPIPGLTIIRALAPSNLDYAISRPLVALVVQGEKHVATGNRTLVLGPGDTLLITADVPTISRITRASLAVPYFSVVLDLDPATIADLSAEIGPIDGIGKTAVRSEPAEHELTDAASRLMRLLERPQAIPVLGRQVVRELHYWLLSGRHGAAIRRLGWPGGHVERISRAVSVLRNEYRRPLRIERLADVAGMSPSSFHQHFRSVTSLSPLRFQKQLRLIEARRLLMSQGLSASSAAYAVGYESVPQFTREYGRMFGLPPAKDAAVARGRATAAA